MSLSNPRPENPVKKWIEFKGDTGVFQYWDKATESNIVLPTERIGFIVLDELNTITGFHKATKSGIYSNEVHNITQEQITVNVFKSQIHIAGYYKEIKDNIKAIGGKFCKSIYAALITGAETIELVNFKFSGASFSGWLDKKVNVFTEGVKITGMKDERNGNIDYKVPIFSGFPMTDILKEKAVAMDVEVQEYLKQYKSKMVEKDEAIINDEYTDNTPTADAVKELFKTEEVAQVTDPGLDLPF